MIFTALLACVCVQVTPARASDDGAGDPSALSGSAGGHLIFGQISNDVFMSIYLFASFEYDRLSVGLQAPIRLRLADEAPHEGVWRAEDWDEVSDYFRVIRYAQWDTPDALFYARLGEFAGASIGHSTIVNNYLNVIDLDHFQLGLDSEFNLLYGGAQLMLDNLADPSIVGGRLYARPLSFRDPDGYGSNWTVGTSFFADIHAPNLSKIDASGRPRIDDSNNLLFDTQAVYLYGLDTELLVYEGDVVAVMPYMDFNFLFTEESGFGYHLGILTEFVFPVLERFTLKAEYQYLGSHYIPQYIDPLYELQRQIYPSPIAYQQSATPPTKQQIAADRRDTGRNGWFVQLGFDFVGLVELGGFYQDYEGDDNANALVQLKLPAFERFQFGVVYTKSGFDSGAEFFDLDGALFQVFAQAKVWWAITALGYYNRTWRVINNPDDPNNGRYSNVDDWGIGAGVVLDF